MGTRNLICVVLNNEYKVAQYSQYDGYFTGQGDGIVNFIRNEMLLGKFIEQLNKIEFVSEEFVEALYNQYKTEFKIKYPEFHRNIGSDILKWIQETNNSPIYLQSNIEFAKESLFCEFCYVINIDTLSLEVYVGFNKFPLDKEERFYCNGIKVHDEYYPVKLYEIIPFQKLTKNTMTELETKLNKEDEE